MGRLGVVVLIVMTTLASGCGLLSNGARNLCNEPHLALEERQQRRRAMALARSAWGQRNACHPGASNDVRDGFLDGFSDYLEGGHTTDPPPVPPKKYQKATYQTPATLRAIEDYFAGFHEGASAAQQSGLRKAMVIPILLPNGVDPIPIHAPLPERELLPPPRELPGGAAK